MTSFVGSVTPNLILGMSRSVDDIRTILMISMPTSADNGIQILMCCVYRHL